MLTANVARHVHALFVSKDSNFVQGQYGKPIRDLLDFSLTDGAGYYLLNVSQERPQAPNFSLDPPPLNRQFPRHTGLARAALR
jgi:hypothetical protein